jgi:hypothetical protein
MSSPTKKRRENKEKRRIEKQKQARVAMPTKRWGVTTIHEGTIVTRQSYGKTRVLLDSPFLVAGGHR